MKIFLNQYYVENCSTIFFPYFMYWYDKTTKRNDPVFWRFYYGTGDVTRWIHYADEGHAQTTGSG
jgi:hypothetical protein